MLRKIKMDFFHKIEEGMQESKTEKRKEKYFQHFQITHK